MKKMKVSLKQALYFAIFVPLGLLALSFILTLIFAILYVSTKSLVNLILLIVFFVLFVIVFVFGGIFAGKRLYKFAYKGIYEATDSNIKSLLNNRVDIINYPSVGIKEIDDLNDSLDALEGKFANSTLVANAPDYTSLALELDDKFPNVYTYKTFKDNIQNIIMLSNSFRNLVIEFYYKFEEDNFLKDEEIDFILKVINVTFKDYDSTLVALGQRKRSVYLYIPNIDSFSRIQEKLTNVVDELSVSEKTSEGIIAVPVKIIGVAYPYSDADEIFHDLTYAKTSEEPINLYFPNRITNINAKDIKTGSTNINIVSKVVETLGELDASNHDEKIADDIIRRGFKEVATYLGLDQCGIILFNNDSKQYYSKINLSSAKFSLFQEGNAIDTDFVTSLGNTVDKDGTYYFSSRNHANNEIGRLLDKYDIDGGFYFVIRNDNTLRGIIYFFNQQKGLLINSFLRESLSLFSNKVSDYFINFEAHKNVDSAYEEVYNILKLANTFIYRVDKETRQIVSYSRNADTYVRNIKEGEICYKCIHGLEKPCPGCPLVSGKKLVSAIDGVNIETSLKLDVDNNAKVIPMVCTTVSEEGTSTDFYDRDLLINTFPVLARDLESSYAAAGKGYLLLLRIDNLDDLLEKYGSEKVLVGMKNFYKNIKNNNMGIQNIFYFNSQTAAVLFKELGQIDIVNKCEMIYEQSKKNYFDDWDGNSFNVTYLPLVYPSGYAKYSDFLRHAYKFFEAQKGFLVNKDLIYFEENEYTRPASRKDFMLTVIDDKFGNSTFKALLQPYVKASDRSVYGAEMLLRLTDDYRKIVFNADELIKVAATNGKISVISDALIGFIGNLYKKQGSSIFKVFGLKRLSINTDYSYFQEEDSIIHLTEMIKEYNFPKEFLGFEINEWDIKAHYKEFAEVAPKLVEHNITLICDQYSGRDLSIEKLKDIGFSEVKVGRSFGGFLDSDPQKRAAFTTIVETAKALGVKVSIVGIENIDQYDIVKKLDSDALLQGYYFYKPLEKDALIGALRANNTPTN